MPTKCDHFARTELLLSSQKIGAMLRHSLLSSLGGLTFFLLERSSEMLTCNPAPFSDPIPDVNGLLSDMVARVHGEEALKKLEATEYEMKPTHLKRFLTRNQYELEPSLAQWSEWVQWRHGRLRCFYL